MSNYKKIDPFKEYRIPELQIRLSYAQEHIESLEKRAMKAEMLVKELSKDGKSMEFSKLLEIDRIVWGP